MNAVGNGWKFTEGISEGVSPSLAYQGFFMTAQGFLGTRSLYSSYQGRKYARWSGAWYGQKPKTELDNAQGVTWRKAARTTGIPRKELWKANLPEFIAVPDWGGGVLTRPKTLTTRPGWTKLAAQLGVPVDLLRQVNGSPTGKRPRQATIQVPVGAGVPAKANWKTVNALIRDLAKTYAVSSTSIKDFNGVGGRTINRQSIKVPDYVWERDSQSGRWMQVAGAGNMAAASGTLAFVDYPIWAPPTWALSLLTERFSSARQGRQ
jgi:hypothetical protein